jgi:polyisoprenoid-binding protein YceI
MSLVTVKLARNAAFAALFVAMPMAVAAQKNPGVAEDATAAAQYKALNVSKDPKVVAAGEYRLDPHHTSVIAKLAHMALSHYTLRFDTISGQLAFDPDNATASNLQISIDPTSVDTGDQAFDKEIATKYFETGKYPSIAFNATAVEIVGDHFLVDGILDFHGVRKPVALHVTYRGLAQSRMGFSGEATFKRSEFGVGEWVPLEADEVTILVEAEFVNT